VSNLQITVLFLCCVIVNACTPSMPISAEHIKDTVSSDTDIPQPVQQSPILRPPKPSAELETYSVSVTDVPVQPLLFSLARDATLNIDIYPGIEGNVSLNAINQTLPQLLSRIAKQVDMRYELNGSNLAVMPDTPFLRSYKVDYVNVARTTASKINIDTQIATEGGGGSNDNNSTTAVSNKSDNRFWATLVENIKDILRETDKLLPEDASKAGTEPANAPAQVAPDPLAALIAAAAPAATTVAAPAPRTTFREAASVIANAETGLIAVRATSRQHEKIQEFLDMALSSAKRQVLIEATIIEVQLDDQYQQGINWANLRSGDTGFNMTQGQVGSTGLSSGVTPGTTGGLFVGNYANPTSALGNISSTIQLLESFGKVKVLSSPKIGVLNNQTAVLKVVDNRVYFTITATTTPGSLGVAPTSTYTSDLHTVPVGFVMTVTPQIAESDEVTLNVRPSISRIISFVQDPNPALANAVVPVVSSVPVIQTREMESILKITSGQVAVMGGLMQDSVKNAKDAIPGLSSIPFIGNFFSYRNEAVSKTELVIFLRPMVVKDASLSGDYKAYRHLLQNESSLSDPPYSEPTGTPDASEEKSSDL
jgi:MSHA biogenesis protein MshL